MGNAAGKLTPCFCPAAGPGEISGRHDIAVVLGNPLDEGFGHSFCYIRPDHFGLQSKSSSLISGSHLLTPPFFRTISGASISANTSTPLSTTLFLDPYPNPTHIEPFSSSFESSSSFASVPLQPIPRSLVVNSGPLPARNSISGSGSLLGSGPIEHGFLSGPIERAFLSGPIDHRTLQDQVRMKSKYKLKKWGSFKDIKDSILEAIRGSGSGKGYNSTKQTEWDSNGNNESVGKSSIASANFNLSGHMSGSLCDDNDNGGGGLASSENQSLQWAQGKAGEDRVHIVISEDHGWVFVGIYDGFNGPDAPDFLLSHLYSAVHKELMGLLQIWSDRSESESESISGSNQSTISKDSNQGNQIQVEVNNCLRRFSGMDTDCSSSWCVDHEFENGDPGIDSNSINLMRKQGNGNMPRSSSNRTKAETLGSSWDRNSNSNSNRKQIFELGERIREKMNQIGSNKFRHSEVMKALSEALRKTEEAYLDITDKMVKENPELCLMGSCVLVMLMMGQDIYLMNVGDSRAVVGQKAPDSDLFEDFPNVSSLQLTMDHNTYVKEEVKRIRSEHLDDPSAVVNHRVKGSLKVTRAFGAGFLKQPKWNEALLESFRIDYVGSLPYITCRPSLNHHKVGSRDKFLILSSDGLYQYFTNEEAVSEVELFMASTPEGDPAQHLIEEVLFRAAKKAGMDFHELLEIPQGERRRYHDDVSAIVISLEGRIWRSSV